MSRKISNLVLITIFALLHAASTLLCRSLGVDDSIVLTLLTMTLTVMICVRQSLTLEFTAISIILVNIIGYVAGLAIAGILDGFISSPMLLHSLSTFITTCLIGWGMVGFCRLFSADDESESISDVQIRWIVAAVALVLLVRILTGALLKTQMFSGGSLMDVVASFLSNTVVVFTMVALTVLFVQYIKSSERNFTMGETIVASVVFFVIVCTIASLMVGYGIPFKIEGEFTIGRFLELLIVAVLCELTIYSVVYMIDYAIRARRNMELERERANLAQSRYQNLKQQVNPHFLFNSLNILDCLVAEKKDDQARSYIRKLAGIYRYMLRNESEPMVKLSDEMEYSSMYGDLLLVRFPSGLKIEKEVRQEDLSRYVITYSVQMLLENAVKHNAVSPQTPLVIRMWSDGEYIHVENNRIPRIAEATSTGVGLKYIVRNYRDTGGREVRIQSSDTSYRVSLPLL